MWLDIHNKIILYDWIHNLNFEDKELIHAMHSTIDQIYIYIYIERERESELGYGVTRSTDGPYTIDCFSVFKFQMIDPTGYNVLHIKI
jgi:hypothetical protein